MLENDYNIFVNRFINVILEVFNMFKENDFKYPELFYCAVLPSRRSSKTKHSGGIQILLNFS